MLNRVENEFDNVIVVINSAGAIELGFLENNKIDAALWLAGSGQTGLESLGRILNGTG